MYKTQNMYDFIEGLGSLLEKDMNAVTAYKVQKNYNKVMEEYKLAEGIRKDLLKKHGETEEASAQFIKLLDQEVEITLTMIKLEDLSNVDTTPRTLGLISKLIDDGEDEIEEAEIVEDPIKH